MTTRDRDAWRRAMGEAASLPPDDPRRLEVQAEVAQVGPWAEEEWLALLEEGERWRLELARTEVPVGLEDRLLRIPSEHRGAPRPLGRILPAIAWAGIAAALLIAVGVWFARRSPDDRPDPLDGLARLAVHDHLGSHALEVASGDPGDVAAGLAPRIPFEVRIPDLGEGPRLLGGRRCTLGAHPVCFTAWRQGEARLTLIQFRSRDFDLPPGLAPRIARARAAQGDDPARGPLDVLVWTEEEFGWALVADDPALLARIRPRSR